MTDKSKPKVIFCLRSETDIDKYEIYEDYETLDDYESDVMVLEDNIILIDSDEADTVEYDDGKIYDENEEDDDEEAYNEDEDEDEKDDDYVDKTKLTCVICNFEFKSKKALKNHQVIHKTFTCPTCNKAFYRETFLTRHINSTHKKSKNLHCPICEKVMKTVYNLKQHLLTHSDERNFECRYDGCDKKFRQISSLQAHEKIHLTQNRKECPKCGKMVTRLQEHVWTHSETKPYKCSMCSKQYTTKTRLTEHELLHESTEKPFKCSQCMKRFNTATSLMRHTQSIHLKKRKFLCEICKKEFSRKDNVKAHFKAMHEESKIDS